MGELIVGIDIGTSKVCTLIARVNDDKQIEVLGRGLELCSGVKKGTIVDIESTSSSIKASILQAESMAEVKVVSAYVNIPGMHLNIINNRSWIDIPNANMEISESDVLKVLDAARNIQAPEGTHIVDIIPRYYIVEECEEIVDPVGMIGSKLGLNADIIAAKVSAIQSIMKCMEKCGVKVAGLIVESLATSEIVLTHDEKEMGVLLIDVGSEITDLTLFRGNNLIFNVSIPVGGENITNDIAIGIKTPFLEAEKIKKDFNLALAGLIKFDQDIIVNDITDNSKKNVKISEVVNIIEARVYEIFSICRDILEKEFRAKGSMASIILTGRGIAYFDGARELASEVFNTSVRVVSSKGIMGINMEYITAAGMVKYASINCNNDNMTVSEPVKKLKNTRDTHKSKKGFWETIACFLRKFF